MSLHIDGEWRRQIRGYVQRADITLRDLSSSKTWDFIASLLDDYNEAAAVAMGSVNARGGYPTIEFRGAKMFDTEWKKLSKWTVAFKNGMDEDPGDGMRGEIIGSYWNMYADSTPIWEFTGGAQGALDTNYRKGIAGILDGPALEYASLVEYGGQGDWQTENGPASVPSRPLFSALNEAFEHYVHRQLSDKNSQLYKEIIREVKARGKYIKGRIK